MKPKQTHHIHIPDLTDEAASYLDSAARIRKISRSRLLSRVLKVVCEDQLILSVLDDDSKQPRMLAYERTPSHYNQRYRGA